MFLIESNLRKIINYLLITILVIFSFILILRIYDKYSEYLNNKKFKEYEQLSYFNYLSQSKNQRNEIQEFLTFLIENEFYLIEFDYSYSNGPTAKVSALLELNEKIISKYSINEISKLKIGEKFYVVLEIKR
ncbi:hypothetical protein [Petrotoga sp. 9PWA.NaAc.5.4]|uniref:hypothetical protein n=1 Tax=Petrotoga sp. 9PWA.NaAc.5.4 TaxID=1434328 RepID=UPI000CBCE292|nr:hypothetical protein [Petrotoga sp. 9PWA.NaAc.5.4]PNR96838.1 hypothetical protein X924_02215 [Petrotoga sp. 9PWA.NaAc.5.4]